MKKKNCFILKKLRLHGKKGGGNVSSRQQYIIVLSDLLENKSRSGSIGYYAVSDLNLFKAIHTLSFYNADILQNNSSYMQSS